MRAKTCKVCDWQDWNNESKDLPKERKVTIRSVQSWLTTFYNPFRDILCQPCARWARGFKV